MASMGTITIKLTDHSDQVLAAVQNAKERGLMACGSDAEGYAKDNCPVDTGRLRNSITHMMDGDDTVCIGTNTEYAVYVECGTGIYATLGGGRTTPWTYQDSSGNWHMTHGNRAHPYIKPAVADHTSDYFEKLKDSFRNA